MTFEERLEVRKADTEALYEILNEPEWAAQKAQWEEISRPIKHQVALRRLEAVKRIVEELEKQIHSSKVAK